MDPVLESETTIRKSLEMLARTRASMQDLTEATTKSILRILTARQRIRHTDQLLSAIAESWSAPDLVAQPLIPEDTQNTNP